MKKYSGYLIFASFIMLIFICTPVIGTRTRVGDPGCDPLDPSLPH